MSDKELKEYVEEQWKRTVKLGETHNKLVYKLLIE